MCRAMNNFGKLEVGISVHVQYDVDGTSDSTNTTITCDAVQREEDEKEGGASFPTQQVTDGSSDGDYQVHNGSFRLYISLRTVTLNVLLFTQFNLYPAI